METLQRGAAEQSIRMIAMDIDGTLTNGRGEISPETRDALIKVQEHGVILVLASGRTDTWLLPLAKAIQMDRFHGFVIGFNGAKISEASGGNTSHNQELSPADVKTALHHLESFRVTVSVYDRKHKYIGNPEKHLSILVNDCGYTMEKAENSIRKLIVVENLADFIDFPTYKLVVNGEQNYLSSHREEMESPLRDVMSTTFSTDCYLEFTGKDVSKATALSVILEQLGISSQELMAFGDAENDAAMLKMAGRGIAMGNASDELKAVADEITLSNDENGIAAAIQKYFPSIFN